MKQKLKLRMLVTNQNKGNPPLKKYLLNKATEFLSLPIITYAYMVR
jgi:hypothetical protein